MLSWKVLIEDMNKKEIKFYDIFENNYWEQLARDLKVEFPNKSEWEEVFRIKLMARYWSRSEYEVVVTSWPPYIKVEDIEKLQKEVEDREKTWNSKPVRVNITPTIARKIDVFGQLQANWNIFINYVWENV